MPSYIEIYRCWDKKPSDNKLDYRGEIFVNLINLGHEDFTINRGDRIAQMILHTFEQAVLNEVTEINETQRGADGHCSTGVK